MRNNFYIVEMDPNVYAVEVNCGNQYILARCNIIGDKIIINTSDI